MSTPVAAGLVPATSTDRVADAVAAQAKEQGAATAAGDEVGYAPGDTSDFRALDT